MGLGLGGIRDENENGVGDTHAVKLISEISPDPLFDRNGRDGLENATGNLVGITLGVRTTVFEVAFVAVVHEAVRDAD